jgi:DNA-binding transcriptional MerR regulator
MTAKTPAEPRKAHSITQLSRELGVTQRALRYYEDVGLLSPTRRAGGGRLYSSKDRARVILILGGRAMGMPLEAIGRLFEVYEDVDGDVHTIATALNVLRRQIRLLEARRDEVGRSISMLQSETQRLTGLDPAVGANDPSDGRPLAPLGCYAAA